MLLTKFDEKLYRKTIRQEGYEEGEDRTLLLADRLLDAGRIEDIKRAKADKNYLHQLFDEFGL